MQKSNKWREREKHNCRKIKDKKEVYMGLERRKMVEMVKPESEKRVFLKEWFTSEEFLNKYCYTGEDLGAFWRKDRTQFKVWAPTAEKVFLKIYAFGSREEALEKEKEDFAENFFMEPGEFGTWSVQVEGNLNGLYYTYLVTVDGKTCETGDPYARACGVNGERSMVVNLEQTNPKDWEKDRRPEGIFQKPVIYELHIQDFSYDFHSGVQKDWQGKYLAFTQNKTSLDGKGEFFSCIEYLKWLGVTYVHLLPAFDFGSVDERNLEKEQFNWGYDPVNYNVPEGSYATDAYDGSVRILEFKQMVQALHQAGIGVIMDVVFNHTYHLNSVLQRTVPDYYYRVDSKGNYTNGSACGNDTASEREMFRKFMGDSVCYWATEYHIDGFRFDLMGLHDVKTMNQIRQRLDNLPNGEEILMYGEPWAADKTAMELGAVPAVAKNVHNLNSRIAIFSDLIRDSVKGNNFISEHKGYVNGGKQEVLKAKEKVMASVCGLCKEEMIDKIRPLAPSQIINYISAHDDRTLWDKLVISVKGEAVYNQKDPDILQMNKMAAGIVFTCLGIPFFQAGEEFARTKNGCENSYNCSPKLNQLDWNRAKEYRELIEYYRFLIAMRQTLPVLNRLDKEAAKQILFLEEKGALIGFILEDKENTGRWEQALVYYNPNSVSNEIRLPDGKWKLITDGEKRWNLEGLEIVMDRLELLPRSVTVLGKEKRLKI